MKVESIKSGRVEGLFQYRLPTEEEDRIYEEAVMSKFNLERARKHFFHPTEEEMNKYSVAFMGEFRHQSMSEVNILVNSTFFKPYLEIKLVKEPQPFQN